MTNTTITAQVETITPEKAAALFAMVPEYQRNIRTNRVAQIAHDMESGLWQLNGEPIIISKYGELMDGQHRIAAVIKADVTVPMMVIRGVEPDTYKTIDKCLPRSIADGLPNTPNAKSVSVIAKAWCEYEHTGNATRVGGANGISSVEVQEYALANMDAIQDCHKRYVKTRAALGRFSEVAWAKFEISHTRLYGEEAVKEFAYELSKGTDSESPAVSMIIRTILQGRVDASGGGARPIFLLLQLLSYAFKKWRTGEQIKLCRFEKFDISYLNFDQQLKF